MNHVLKINQKVRKYRAFTARGLTKTNFSGSGDVTVKRNVLDLLLALLVSWNRFAEGSFTSQTAVVQHIAFLKNEMLIGVCQHAQGNCFPGRAAAGNQSTWGCVLGEIQPVKNLKVTFLAQGSVKLFISGLEKMPSGSFQSRIDFILDIKKAVS